jgi:hypothetical protein
VFARLAMAFLRALAAGMMALAGAFAPPRYYPPEPERQIEEPLQTDPYRVECAERK